METVRWAGLNLLLLFAAGSALAIVGHWRQELSVRETLARLLYDDQNTRSVGPPQLSRSRRLTLLLGIVGAVVGGWITSLILGVDLVSGFNLTSIIVAILGAIVVIAIYRLITRGSAARV